MLAWEFGVREGVDDLAVLDDVEAVGDGGGEAEILLHQQDGEALRLEPRDHLADLLDDDRGQTFGRLVQHQEPGARCAGCGRSPASAVRHRTVWCPGLPRRSFRFGNSSKIWSSVMPPLRITRRQQQILFHIEAGEDAALFRAERHAEPRDLLGGKPDQVATFERHRAGALADQAHHRLERRGLAGAIAAEQRHHLARAKPRSPCREGCGTRRTTPRDS